MRKSKENSSLANEKTTSINLQENQDTKQENAEQNMETIAKKENGIFPNKEIEDAKSRSTAAVLQRQKQGVFHGLEKVREEWILLTNYEDVEDDFAQVLAECRDTLAPVVCVELKLDKQKENVDTMILVVEGTRNLLAEHAKLIDGYGLKLESFDQQKLMERREIKPCRKKEKTLRRDELEMKKKKEQEQAIALAAEKSFLTRQTVLKSERENAIFVKKRNAKKKEHKQMQLAEAKAKLQKALEETKRTSMQMTAMIKKTRRQEADKAIQMMREREENQEEKHDAKSIVDQRRLEEIEIAKMKSYSLQKQRLMSNLSSHSSAKKQIIPKPAEDIFQKALEETKRVSMQMTAMNKKTRRQEMDDAIQMIRERQENQKEKQGEIQEEKHENGKNKKIEEAQQRTERLAKLRMKGNQQKVIKSRKNENIDEYENTLKTRQMMAVEVSHKKRQMRVLRERSEYMRNTEIREKQELAREREVEKRQAQEKILEDEKQAILSDSQRKTFSSKLAGLKKERTRSEHLRKKQELKDRLASQRKTELENELEKKKIEKRRPTSHLREKRQVQFKQKEKKGMDKKAQKRNMLYLESQKRKHELEEKRKIEKENATQRTEALLKRQKLRKNDKEAKKIMEKQTAGLMKKRKQNQDIETLRKEMIDDLKVDPENRRKRFTAYKAQEQKYTDCRNKKEEIQDVEAIRKQKIEEFKITPTARKKLFSENTKKSSKAKVKSTAKVVNYEEKRKNLIETCRSKSLRLKKLREEQAVHPGRDVAQEKWTFDGDFQLVVKQRKQEFERKATDYLGNVRLIDVTSGSIVLIVEGHSSHVQQKGDEIEANLMELDGFPPFVMIGREKYRASAGMGEKALLPPIKKGADPQVFKKKRQEALAQAKQKSQMLRKNRQNAEKKREHVPKGNKIGETQKRNQKTEKDADILKTFQKRTEALLKIRSESVELKASSNLNKEKQKHETKANRVQVSVKEDGIPVKRSSIDTYKKEFGKIRRMREERLKQKSFENEKMRKIRNQEIDGAKPKNFTSQKDLIEQYKNQTSAKIHFRNLSAQELATRANEAHEKTIDVREQQAEKRRRKLQDYQEKINAAKKHNTIGQKRVIQRAIEEEVQRAKIIGNERSKQDSERRQRKFLQAQERAAKILETQQNTESRNLKITSNVKDSLKDRLDEKKKKNKKMKQIEMENSRKEQIERAKARTLERQESQNSARRQYASAKATEPTLTSFEHARKRAKERETQRKIQIEKYRVERGPRQEKRTATKHSSDKRKKELAQKAILLQKKQAKKEEMLQRMKIKSAYQHQSRTLFDEKELKLREMERIEENKKFSLLHQKKEKHQEKIEISREKSKKERNFEIGDRPRENIKKATIANQEVRERLQRRQDLSENRFLLIQEAKQKTQSNILKIRKNKDKKSVTGKTEKKESNQKMKNKNKKSEKKHEERTHSSTRKKINTDKYKRNYNFK